MRNRGDSRGGGSDSDRSPAGGYGPRRLPPAHGVARGLIPSGSVSFEIRYAEEKAFILIRLKPAATPGRFALSLRLPCSPGLRPQTDRNGLYHPHKKSKPPTERVFLRMQNTAKDGGRASVGSDSDRRRAAVRSASIQRLRKGVWGTAPHSRSHPFDETRRLQ